MEREIIERIEYENQLLTLIIRKGHNPRGIEFLTSPHLNQQIGAMSHPAGHVIKRHVHKPIERKVIGTSEVLIIKKGVVELDVYNLKKELTQKILLREGDIAFLINGGHGIKVIEDSTIIEVKQGPYVEGEDKEHF